ncbi:MAG: UDP-N-acetylmuramoyl-tripeptide--D-alanyl-D-alanine ligase [Desulfohalobiaceae bacterium]|nr:UDP-N-acetylmuramoyl-tripeptide--D-alanyl-D-alanine ligase [Desulfohalobiaceae bacterium]
MRPDHILQATGAEITGSSEEIAIRGVRTDSRQVRPGDLFVCLPGERVDGHAFAEDAVQRGAVAVMAREELPGIGNRVPVFRVRDCLTALGDLGAWWRDRFQGTLIALTGSAGKTSLKELLASILAQRAETAKNYQNWNNRLGVPLSLLGFSGRERYWVLEAGVNQTGEMDELARILRPDVALIHNVGPAHLEGMGSQEGVAREKSKLAAAVREKGLAIVSADYPILNQALPDRADLRMTRFSCRQAQVPYRGEYLGHSDERGLYRLHLDGTEIEVAPGFREGYQLENILAAAATAWELGCDTGDIEAGLAGARLPEHRGQMIRVGGWCLIDDCYNANPVSVRCALQSARDLTGSGALIAFLGDMLELGDEAEAAHLEMGRQAARQGVDHLLYSGSYIREVERGFREAGGRDGPHPVETSEELRSFCRGLEPKGGTVLLKASRGCRLERFLHALQRELGE